LKQRIRCREEMTCLVPSRTFGKLESAKVKHVQESSFLFSVICEH
jgi:hypothetical protein